MRREKYRTPRSSPHTVARPEWRMHPRGQRPARASTAPARTTPIPDYHQQYLAKNPYGYRCHANTGPVPPGSLAV